LLVPMRIAQAGLLRSAGIAAAPVAMVSGYAAARSYLRA